MLGAATTIQIPKSLIPRSQAILGHDIPFYNPNQHKMKNDVTIQPDDQYDISTPQQNQPLARSLANLITQAAPSVYDAESSIFGAQDNAVSSLASGLKHWILNSLGSAQDRKDNLTQLQESVSERIERAQQHMVMLANKFLEGLGADKQVVHATEKSHGDTLGIAHRIKGGAH